MCLEPDIPKSQTSPVPIMGAKYDRTANISWARYAQAPDILGSQISLGARYPQELDTSRSHHRSQIWLSAKYPQESDILRSEVSPGARYPRKPDISSSHHRSQIWLSARYLREPDIHRSHINIWINCVTRPLFIYLESQISPEVRYPP